MLMPSGPVELLFLLFRMAADISDVVTCRLRPFPIATGLGRFGGSRMWTCPSGLRSEFLSEVQCAQYWPHSLHPGFICHGLAS